MDHETLARFHGGWGVVRHFGGICYDFVPPAGRIRHVNRAVQIGRPASSAIRICELTIVRPADKVVASPITVPSVADR